MTPRINPFAHMDMAQSLIAYGRTVEAMGLEPELMELVKLRASQINGCSRCLHYHTTDALKLGVDPMHIILLDGWREAPVFSAREQAALAWTEALTRMDRRAEEEAYARVAAVFSSAEQVALNLLIGVINSFNRLNIGFGIAPDVEATQQAA